MVFSWGSAMRSKLLCALAACVFTATPALAVEADAIVAAIGYEVVARSTLVAYRESFAPKQAPAEVLQTLIDNRLLAAEARRYAISSGSADVAALRQAHPAPPTFTAAEWDRLLRERVLARKFLDFRFGDFVPVSRDAVLALMQAKPAEFKGDTMANEAKARKMLLPAARAEREQAFLLALRDRGEVRFVPDVMPAP